MEKAKLSVSKRQKIGHLFNTPAILYGQATRFMPGQGRNTRGRYSQTDPSIPDQQEEACPAEALAACKKALESAEAEIDTIQRRHRERWVQHHLFMWKTAVWEEEVYQRTRHLRDAFSSIAKNIRSALPSRKRKRSSTTSPAEQAPEPVSLCK